MTQNTAEQILNVAEEVVRNRGYSAFSYADISKQVGIRKASIHYHFPAKDELVEALVKRYRENMARACNRIAQSSIGPDQQLIQFANLYRDSLAHDQVCLCAMLSADFAVLSESVQQELRAFFTETENWLEDLLQKGCDAQLRQCQLATEQEAKGLIAMLQGAQLLARASADSVTTFEQTVYPLLKARFSSP